ncbi:MAG TPA: aquaporin [Candidatus Saccharimonadales bacterium]|nr:aquaporin [Candidatus Saccharimonadales bacterium]
MFGKRKIATLVAEFLGTGALTLAILSVQRSTIGVPFFVATAAGLTVALVMFAMGGASGGYFNPAITIGMWTARRISTLVGILYVAVQLLGGWAAYGLYTYFANNHLQPIGGHYTTRILIAESVGAAVFAFGFAAAVYQRFSASTTAAYAGVAYMLGILLASTAAIGLLNPAVALGVRSWVWGTYVAGPIIGAVVGINLYDLLFAAEGESSNVLTAAMARPVASKAAVAKPVAKKKSSRAKK